MVEMRYYLKYYFAWFFHVENKNVHWNDEKNIILISIFTILQFWIKINHLHLIIFFLMLYFLILFKKTNIKQLSLNTQRLILNTQQRKFLINFWGDITMFYKHIIKFYSIKIIAHLVQKLVTKENKRYLDSAITKTLLTIK